MKVNKWGDMHAVFIDLENTKKNKHTYKVLMCQWGEDVIINVKGKGITCFSLCI